jgi:hypothetical protein
MNVRGNSFQLVKTSFASKFKGVARKIMSSYMGRFTMFSVITNSYNNKTKRPALMELFTTTEKLKNVVLQLKMFDKCTTGDTAHIDMIFKFLPHTRQHGCIDILHCCDDPCLKA